MNRFPWNETSSLVVDLYFSKRGCRVRWQFPPSRFAPFAFAFASDLISSTLGALILNASRGVLVSCFWSSVHLVSTATAFSKTDNEHQVDAHVSTVSAAESSKSSTSPMDATMDLATRMYSASPRTMTERGALSVSFQSWEENDSASKSILVARSNSSCTTSKICTQNVEAATSLEDSYCLDVKHSRTRIQRSARRLLSAVREDLVPMFASNASPRSTRCPGTPDFRKTPSGSCTAKERIRSRIPTSSERLVCVCVCVCVCVGVVVGAVVETLVQAFGK
mmetsp:Transcript_22873/g.49826  ORF Transcript_22873/g.49826 Transcript_22873/m.49826 type:complete len:279 (+) Transcript_22873:187-1023(+)